MSGAWEQGMRRFERILRGFSSGKVGACQISKIWPYRRPPDLGQKHSNTPKPYTKTSRANSLTKHLEKTRWTNTYDCVVFTLIYIDMLLLLSCTLTGFWWCPLGCFSCLPLDCYIISRWRSWLETPWQIIMLNFPTSLCLTLPHAHIVWLIRTSFSHIVGWIHTS